MAGTRRSRMKAWPDAIKIERISCPFGDRFFERRGVSKATLTDGSIAYCDSDPFYSHDHAKKLVKNAPKMFIKFVGDGDETYHCRTSEAAAMQHVKETSFDSFRQFIKEADGRNRQRFGPQEE